MSMRRQRFLLFRVYRFQDAKAYGALYDLYYARIRRYLFFRLPTSEDADEATAEVFLRGWEYTTSSSVENAGALFYRIAKNLIADFYRSQKIESSLDEAISISKDERLDDSIDAKDEVGKLMISIRSLKPDFQDVIIMRFIDEMSVKEIAFALEKTPNSVRVQIHRAKKALEKIKS